MNNQQQLNEERYQADLQAIAEAIYKGVSAISISQLAFECSIDKRDLEELYASHSES